MSSLFGSSEKIDEEIPNFRPRASPFNHLTAATRRQRNILKEETKASFLHDVKTLEIPSYMKNQFEENDKLGIPKHANKNGVAKETAVRKEFSFSGSKRYILKLFQRKKNK